MYRSSQTSGKMRLLDIVTMLKNDERPTKQELSEILGVSTRTIDRDLKMFDLAQYGILKDDSGRYYTKESLKSYSDGELSVLHLSMVIIQSAGSLFLKSSKSVLKMSLPSQFNNAYEITPLNIEFLKNMESKIMKTILEGIEDSEKILIVMNNKNIILEPYKIKPLRGLWYLIACDSNTKEVKPYRIKNIQNVTLQSIPFKIPYDIDEKMEWIVSSFFDDDEIINIKVKVSHTIAEHFSLVKHVENQHIMKQYSDGSLLVEYKVSHEEDIDNIIKSWLPDIEVIEPRWYAEQIIDELDSYVERLRS